MGNWSRILGASRGHRWRRKAGAPQFLAERHEQVWECDGGLGAIPRTHDPAERAALLEVRSRPQQDEAIDQPSERSGPGDRLGCLVLRLAEAEVLLAVMEGHFQGPAMRISLEHERRIAAQISAEERLLTASSTRVSDDHDPHELRAKRAVPQRVQRKEPRRDGTAVEHQWQGSPAPTLGD